MEKAKSLSNQLIGKQANIWVTTIIVLLVLWFVISMFIFANGHSPFALKYNQSYACGSAESLPASDPINTGGTSGGVIHLGVNDKKPVSHELPCQDFFGGSAMVQEDAY